MSARLTVVIPVHSLRGGMLEACLGSLRSQTAAPEDYKVIFVDNGAPAGVRKLLDSWCMDSPAALDARVLTEKRPGAGAARQCGLDDADTPWIMFFDSDDTMLPGHLARILAKLDSGAELLVWDLRPGLSSRKALDPWRRIMKGTLSTARWAARTELLRRAGGWNPELTIWEDMELGSRIAALGPRWKRLTGAPTAVVNFSADSVTGTDYLSMARRMDATLRLVEHRLPDKDKWMIQARRAVVYGLAEAQTPGAGEPLMEAMLAEVKSRRMRVFLKAFFQSYRLGLRGMAGVLKFFIIFVA